jgi:Trk K+ transport system NAD-binding subunit
LHLSNNAITKKGVAMTISNISSEIHSDIYSSVGRTHSHIEKPKDAAQQNLDGLTEAENI